MRLEIDKKKALISVAVIVGFIAAFVVAGKLTGVLSALTVKRSWVLTQAMDSVAEITIFGDKHAHDIAYGAVDEIRKLEKDEISRFKAKSSVDLINHGREQYVSADFAEALEKCLELSEKSGGAFDVTVGELTKLWNFDDPDFALPDSAAVEAARDKAGYESVRIEKKDDDSGKDGGPRYKVTIGEGQSLDFGAVGKGMGCDVAREYFREHKVRGAIMNLGGNVLVYGDTGKKTKTVAIRSPEAQNYYIGVLELTGDKVISTSGSYEKNREIAGKLYHHIIDPATGYPAESGLLSVTVVSEDGLLADALSTACFVLGCEKGKELIKEYDAGAVFVTTENRVIVTGNLKGRFKLKNKDYVM